LFDDTRETGIRADLREALQDVRTASSLSETGIGRHLIDSVKERDASGNDLAALDETVQKEVERALDDGLAWAWTVWRE